jgi:hypothetical protein
VPFGALIAPALLGLCVLRAGRAGRHTIAHQIAENLSN